MSGSRQWTAALVAALAVGMLSPDTVGAAPGQDASPTAASSGVDGPITVTELVDGEGDSLPLPTQINERGDVLAFDVVWRDGVATRIGSPSCPFTVPQQVCYPVATDVSERGQVAGTVIGISGIAIFIVPYSPFSWRDGELTELVPDGAGLGVAVNEQGQMLALEASDIATLPDGDIVVWHDGDVIAAPDDASPGLPWDINERGQALVDVFVEGGSGSWMTDPTVAAIWQVGGEVTDLGTLGGATSQGVAINEAGQVAGTSQTASGDEHAFLWQDGEMTDLGTLGGATSAVGGGYGVAGLVFPGFFSQVVNDRQAFNEVGQVAGTSQTASGDEHAFLWQDGEMTDLGTLGGSSSSAYAVNNRGQVVGASETANGEQHAFLWQDGEMTDLGPLAGEGESRATDINDNGQIVGRVGDSEAGFRAVLWTIS